MNETMFKNCFLVTKNKNKNILARSIHCKWNTTISKHDFLCIKMTSLLYTIYCYN